MLTFEVKKFFFDRQAVLKKLPPARRKILSKAGANVWKRAKTSMRYRKRGTSSPPGQPPYAHKETGALLRNFLYFAYDLGTDSVVVGPVKLGRSTVPSLHEFGGSVQRRGRVVNYRKRPTMAPALEAEEPKLPSYWKNTIRGDA